MDGFHVRTGDVLKGQMTLAEFSSPVSFGAVFIRNLTLKRVTADPKGRPRFYLIAEDVFYSSIEGWTVPIWDFRKIGAIRKEDTETYRELIFDRLHAYTMIPWDDGYTAKMKKNIITIASREEFKLSKKELAEFMSHIGMASSVYLEDRKIENLLTLPESAFNGGDAKGLQRQIQKRWGMKG